jgi:iron complex transport system substrate-binding protein
VFRRFRFFFLIAAALSAVPVSRAAPVEATDARGRQIRLMQPAQRIITLAPNLTELVYAAAAGERLAGVARYSDFPPAARNLPVVSDAVMLDLERMLALRADLVLAWDSGTPPEVIARIERAGLPVFVAAAAKLEDIARNLEAVARLAGTEVAARPQVERFAAGLADLRARRPAGPAPRVFYEIWDRPLMTVNNRHLIGEIIALCGGINVFGGERQLTPEVSREALVAAKPDLVLGGTSSDRPQDFAARWRAMAPPMNRWPAHHVNADLIQRPTPRIIEGAREVCARIDAVRSVSR